MDSSLLDQVGQFFERHRVQPGGRRQPMNPPHLFDGEPAPGTRPDQLVHPVDQSDAAPVVDLPERRPDLPADLHRRERRLTTH
jgi:hypothetical protein